MTTGKDIQAAKDGEVDVHSDELVLTDVLKAALRNPGSPTRSWSDGDKSVLNLAAKADRGVSYCESEECKNPEGRTKLRGSRVAIGICSSCQPNLKA